jgi:predicted  nucleic acid-binding Zn-ribbon protein
MSGESRIHFYLNWAKERIDEMDAALASLEGKVSKLQADSRIKADLFIVDLRKRRDEFQGSVKKLAEAGDAAWESAKVQLETEWKKFEAEVDKYLETFGKDVEQHKAVFQGQVAAQIKAWRETADGIHAAAMQFATERRRDIDATVSRMRGDATAAEEKLQKLARAGTESWGALNAALTETRATFDRANQAAREAFKRASGSAH